MDGTEREGESNVKRVGGSFHDFYRVMGRVLYMFSGRATETRPGTWGKFSHDGTGRLRQSES